MLLAVLFSNSEGNILVEREICESVLIVFTGLNAEDFNELEAGGNQWDLPAFVGTTIAEDAFSNGFWTCEEGDGPVCTFFSSCEDVELENFHGVPAEERLHWRSFLVKLGADNLKGVKNEELLVASHKSVYIVYTVLGDVCIYVVGKDDYDELALGEVIFAITSSVKDVCGKPPTERLFLDKYGRICLCLDEIVWKGELENTDKDRIRRLIRLKPPTDV